jgi:hypothetical protein
VVSTSALVLNLSGEIERAIGKGFLKPDDVLVLDNAAINFGGVNDDLGHCGFGVVTVLFPIELIWNMLVQRLKTFPLAPVQGRPHAVAS